MYSISHQFAIQIIFVMMMSVIMMIITVNLKPYQSKLENFGETMNEIAIIIVLYHVIIASEFAPSYELLLKRYNGYSLIGLVTLAVIGYLVYIVF